MRVFTEIGDAATENTALVIARVGVHPGGGARTAVLRIMGPICGPDETTVTPCAIGAGGNDSNFDAVNIGV